MNFGSKRLIRAAYPARSYFRGNMVILSISDSEQQGEIWKGKVGAKRQNQHSWPSGYFHTHLSMNMWMLYNKDSHFMLSFFIHCQCHETFALWQHLSLMGWPKSSFLNSVSWCLLTCFTIGRGNTPAAIPLTSFLFYLFLPLHLPFLLLFLLPYKTPGGLL